MNSWGIRKEVKYIRIKVRNAVSKSGLPDIDYALNPYIGCYHACIYCYGRAYTRYKEVANEWGKVIYIKENLIPLLRGEVKRLRKGIVGVSTITDPYQPIETEEKLTRESLKTLLNAGFKADIQTKSTLILRDLDILTEYRNRVEVGFTITTLRNEIAEVIEPYSPRPGSRAKALQKIAGEGVKTWIFLGPIIPGVNDDEEDIKEIIELAKQTNSELYYDWLRIKEEIKEPLTKGLSKIYGEPALPQTTKEWRKQVEKQLLNQCVKQGVKCYPAF